MKPRLLTFIFLCFSLPLLAQETSDNDALMQQLLSRSTVADILNTDTQIWEDALATTLRAREEMPWGKTVPQREFLSFVLPLRVNNEPIDNHRPIIYELLRERVAGLSMEEAILETNHWCHEYVTYQPSDGRTHSALQSMSSHIGRCGEESTFTVSALRAIGIPARQVYTPRWAHTDDNHAWVEAWANGKWYFIGACEPEPVLDLAWFNAPATRAMMMHTFVRGEYDGPEEVVSAHDDGVVINVTSKYAPVATTTVTVTDSNGNPLPDADVSFRVYNYAEFYPLTIKKSDSNGEASITTGLGDMVVWASKDGDFGFTKIHAGDSDIKLSLSPRADYKDFSFQYDLIPPAQGTNIVTVSDSERAANNARLQKEDSIRVSRMEAEFMTAEAAKSLATALSLPEERVVKTMSLARGNAHILSQFLQDFSIAERQRGLLLLESLSEKDLTDVTTEVLADNMTSLPDTGSFYGKYILSPRIENEELRPWKRELAKRLARKREEYRKNPASWAKWLTDSIERVSDWQPSQITITPVEVLNNKKANLRSRDLLFVAGARALNIPARVDPVTGIAEWADGNGTWNQAFPKSEEAGAKGLLQLQPNTSNRISNPAYYRHFTLSRIVDGEPRLMEFDETADFDNTFSHPVSLETASYLLVTGQRLANGSVLASGRFFDIKEGETTSVPLAIRHDESCVEVIGSFNSENRFQTLEMNESSILQTTGRGYYILGLLRSGQEPSNHALRDIADVANELSASGVPIVILVENQKDATWLAETAARFLPESTALGVDNAGNISSELRNLVSEIRATDRDNVEMPVFIIADTFNRVVFESDGYAIGLGHTLLDIIHKLD